MKIIKSNRTIFLCLLALIISSYSSAFAATIANVSGALDWGGTLWTSSNGLNITTYDVQSTQSSAMVQLDWTPKDIKDKTVLNWNETYSSAASYIGSEGSVSAGSNANPTTTSAFSSINTVSGTLRSQSSIARGGYFWAQGNGTITFNFPYTAVFDLQKASASDWVKAYIVPWINIQNYTSNPAAGTGQGLSYDRSDYYFSGESLLLDGSILSDSETRNGTVSLSLPIANGERIEFFAAIRTYVETYSGEVNTVPEPATMLLFGLGLAGLAGVRRFRK